MIFSGCFVCWFDSLRPSQHFSVTSGGFSWIEPVARVFSEKDKPGCFTFVYFCIYVRVFVLCLFLTVPWLVCDLPGDTHSCLLSEHTRDVRYELLFVLYLDIHVCTNTYLSRFIQVVQLEMVWIKNCNSTILAVNNNSSSTRHKTDLRSVGEQICRY